MQRSEQRILTTHAGSLPRPAALTLLFAQRSYGEAVDEQEIEAQGRAAMRAIVQKQIETGLDVIDDGEQSREFVRALHAAATHRAWRRPARGRCIPISTPIRNTRRASSSA